MTALQQIGQLGESLISGVDAVIDTIGGNIRAQGEQNQNVVDAQRTKIQLEVLQAQAALEQKAENQKLLRVVVYALLGLLTVTFIFKGVMSIINKK